MRTQTRPATTPQWARSFGPWGQSALACALLLTLVFGVSGPAAAQPQEPLTCQRSDEQGLVCRLDASSQLDDRVRSIVETGFTNELVYRLYLFPADDDEPVGVGLVVFAAIFQLYTDSYYISREGVEGYVERSSWSEAVETLARFEVALEGNADLGPGSYFAAAVLEVNPVNEAQLLEARRWIAQSRGGYRLFEQSETSSFGGFLSLFVNADLGSADARRVFRSDTFELDP